MGHSHPTDVRMTSNALMFFGFGIIAFSLVKILANFFFARDNTKTPFYISSFIVLLNLLISISLFKKIGFLIIPIATSISTWAGVFIYLYLLNKFKLLYLKNSLLFSTLKIIISSVVMSLVLITTLKNFSSYLDYTYIYKSIYLFIIVGLAGIVYLLTCYLFGLLKIKDYKAD